MPYILVCLLSIDIYRHEYIKKKKIDISTTKEENETNYRFFFFFFFLIFTYPRIRRIQWQGGRNVPQPKVLTTHKYKPRNDK